MNFASNDFFDCISYLKPIFRVPPNARLASHARDELHQISTAWTVFDDDSDVEDNYTAEKGDQGPNLDTFNDIRQDILDQESVEESEGARFFVPQ